MAEIPVIRDYQITQAPEEEAELEFVTPHFTGANASMIPMLSSVQSTRAFYGSRFFDQAVAQEKPEAAWVQNLVDEETGQSADEYYGRFTGAAFADDDGEVVDVTPDKVVWKSGTTGEKKELQLYRNLPYNRKSVLNQTPVVQPGQRVTKGQALARSNYTDDKGTLALGLNARVGIVPYKGYSMDDAVVMSQAFANRLRSEHSATFAQDFDNEIKGGKSHFHAVLPTAFTKDQLDKMDDAGVVKPGTLVNPGDPLILATKPKVFSSASMHQGKLGKPMRSTRSNASQIWDGNDVGEVVDVVRTRKGLKAVVRSYSSTRDGDKVVFRAGAKGVTSRVVPDDQMPRTEDGRPLDVLYNPLGLVSRANDQLVYEVLLGKVAEKQGKPIKVPNFTKLGESWYDIVSKALQDNGLTDTERVYDPLSNRWLERPITVGNGYLLKLHHSASSKYAARGQSSYTADQQPAKGGTEGAKRISGLEVTALRSSGGYHNLREMSTLRGQQNPEFWAQLRSGVEVKEPGVPFIWRKYLALLEGAGLRAKDLGDGRLRLGPITENRIDEMQPMEVQSGSMLDLNTMEPIRGGLFDPDMVAANKWGYVRLPRPVINPAFTDAVRHLLGLTKKQLEDVLAGRAELPDTAR